MMNWRDEAIVLAARPHGETSLIVSLLTSGHGRHAGLVRGGAGRGGRAVYEPGNRVSATWRARLADHLGNYTCELTRNGAAAMLDEPLQLAGLAAACAVAEAALPEREPHAAVYAGLLAVLDALAAATPQADRPSGWEQIYVRWELGLLRELGFGLDLAACAATGQTEELAWVSPKSGRAVSARAGAPYRDRLLPLPAFLLDPPGAARQSPTLPEIAGGLALTGHFLERHIFAPYGRSLPPARARLAERLAAAAAGGGGGRC